MLHLILERSQFDNSLVQAFWTVMSQSIPTGYIPPGNPRGLAQKNCPRGRDLTFESCPGAGNSTRAGILWKFKVTRFVRVLVLLVINTGCPKIAKNRGTLHCWFPVQTTLNAIQMCAQEEICVPRLLAIFLRHPVSRLVLMWEFPSSDEWGPFSRRWEIPFSFVFLDFTSTCGEQPFSPTKSKASAYE